MDWQTAFNVAFSAAGAGVFLYVQTTRDKIKTLEHDIKNAQQIVSNLREHVATKIATIEFLDRRMTEMFTVLARIEQKIDTKADKK